MRKSGFFPRLALVNLVRNGRFYGPYLLSCVVTAAMYYILRFLAGHETLKTVRGAMYLQSLSDVGCFVVALFAAVILLYANSFVMKRRQKELGLYNILGLEKRHIALVMCWETALCTAAGISAPTRMPIKRLAVRRSRMVFIRLPAAASRPELIICIPWRNSARPPNRPKNSNMSICKSLLRKTHYNSFDRYPEIFPFSL